MPTKTIVENGQTYLVMADGERFPIASEGGANASPIDAMRFIPVGYPGTVSVGDVKQAITNPEVLAGLAAIMAPETGGMSLAIPPLVGGATSIGRDLYNGERDPYTLGARATEHAAVNAIPGVGGAVAKSMKSGTLAFPSVKAALITGSQAPSWSGAILRTLGELMPQSQQAAPLGTKILKGGLSARGAATVHGQSITDMLRAILAGGSATTTAKPQE